MENENLQPQPMQPPAGSNRKKILLKVLLVLVVLGLIAGAFFLGQKTAGSDNGEQARVETAGSAAIEEVSEESAVHFVRSEGYPLDIDPMIVTNLGIPSGMQSVIIESVISDPGKTDVFALNFNEEMGRWLLGYPEGKDIHGGEVSIIAILDEWLDTTNSERIDPFMGPELNTPQQKKKYVDDLKAKTAECVKSEDKGFTTQEDVFKVCYEINVGPQDFFPVMEIEGYGELAGESFFMLGSIPLYDGNDYTDPDVIQKARKEIPGPINQVADSIVNALSQTTVEAVNR